MESRCRIGGAICGACLADYCSCSGRMEGCILHSHCCFCSRSLDCCDEPRLLKRKLGKTLGVLVVDATVDEEEDEEDVQVVDEASRARVDVTALRDALEAEREAVSRLYRELEEERNAAAVAAAETMSMITRLQEEKAALQMEARQFHRIVEERSLYDRDAIEVLNDVLARQEEERLALERELQKYRAVETGESRKRPLGGAEDKAWGSFPSRNTYQTPFGCNSRSRNLMDAFEQQQEQRAGADPSPRTYRPHMDADEDRVHDVYEVPRQQSPSSSSRMHQEYCAHEWRQEPSNTCQAKRTHCSRCSHEQEGHYRKPGQEHEHSDCDHYKQEREHFRKTDREHYKQEHSHEHFRKADREQQQFSRMRRRDISEGSEEDLVSELRRLNSRLQALEADRAGVRQSTNGFGGVMNNSSTSMSGEMQLLEEISQHLRHFQALGQQQEDGKELLQPEASFVFSFKGIFSFTGLRQSLHSQISRLACMFLKHTDASLSYGDAHVGLSHLLESSRRVSSRSVPCVTRGFKLDPPPSSSSSSTVHYRQNSSAWPLDARGRLGTALAGWD